MEVAGWFYPTQQAEDYPWTELCEDVTKLKKPRIPELNKYLNRHGLKQHLENTEKPKIWERVFFLCVCVGGGGGGGLSHPKKLLLQGRGGHVKKIGKLREVMQFLNDDSRIPIATPPS